LASAPNVSHRQVENQAVAWWHGSKSCSQPILSSNLKGDGFRYLMESSSIKKPSGSSAWDCLIFFKKILVSLIFNGKSYLQSALKTNFPSEQILAVRLELIIQSSLISPN
jgi:hypothetical protein